MTDMNAIAPMSLKTLGIELTPIKISDEDFASFQHILNNPPKPTPEQLEASKPYAQIWKDGKLVGEVYKGGCAMTVSNALGMKLKSLFAATDDRDMRAEAIAKASGGTIKYV
jgi:hypothetical protein